VAEKVARTLRAEIRATNAPLSNVLISGLVAGGFLFFLILVAYFSALFAQRGLVSLELRPLFKVFPAADGKTYGTKSTMENIYSVYRGSGSPVWANYEYTGRIMLTDDRGGIGVVFLAHYCEGKDCFYRLKRCGRGGEFAVSGFRTGITGGPQANTNVEPEPRVWYRFKVQVEDADGRTQIKAKVWKDGNAEPRKWQAECCDAGRSRSVKGSVGVWACSEGEKYFDDLLVRPIRARGGERSPNMGVQPETTRYNSSPSKAHTTWPNKARAHDYVLREDFDRFPVGAHPAEWSSGCAPLDLSEAADTVSSLFGMNLLDFGGPWDEIVDLTAVALTFCLAGFLGAIALKLRAGLRCRMPCVGKKWRIPFEFLPFVSLFMYLGAMKGLAIVLYAAAGSTAGYLWRCLSMSLLNLFPSPNIRD